MNILIKLTCLVGLVIAPILGGHTSSQAKLEINEVNKEVVTTEQPKNVAIIAQSGQSE